MNTEKLKNSLPTILSVGSMFGVAGAAAASHFDTKKAMQKLNDENIKPANLKEELKHTWKCYGRTGFISLATIISIAASGHISARTIRNLLAAVSASAELANEYKEKIKQEFGQEGYEQVVRAVAKDHEDGIEDAADVCLHATSFCHCNTDPVIPNDTLFYDDFTKRRFRSSLYAVVNAHKHFNRNYTSGAFANYEMLYEFYGLKPENWYKEVGYGSRTRDDDIWFIDFDLVPAYEDDGVTVKYYVISSVFAPGSMDEEENYYDE